MDSVSQLVLGASVTHLVLAPRIGRRALVLGAVLGTLPDLDVLVRYDSAVDSFTRHRSWSHSLLVLTLLTPVLAWLSRRLMNERAHAGRWLLAVWLALVTHPILDAFTVYGTQLWWPLPSVPVAWGSMFIIDPLFTLPVLTGVWLAWRQGSGSRHCTVTGVDDRAPGGERWTAYRKSRGDARLPSLIGLSIGCAVIGWSLVAQHQARQVAMVDLERQGIAVDGLLVAPFPFTLLWRYVVLTDGRYLEGYHSLLDADPQITFNAYAKGDELLGMLDDPAAAERLRWFTGDLVRFEAREDSLVASDLRMGTERFYVFEFALARSAVLSRWHAITPEALSKSIGFDSAWAVVRRVWDETVDLAPKPVSR